ncbi:hypothetical protein FGLOB1_11763 [Fusarium globosum]|uniref:Uncharacterized protein n=1 Tax=Fusarium globosum TaxID=78864 RepID=A0A8H5XS05_9HYPO|nr:hypothetical protein FGLOB1_11763 [Fusarium globosum]
MSDHHIEKPLAPSSSNKENFSRPQQEGKLALLPVETLLQITGEPEKDQQTQALSHQDFKNLSLSCERFFRELRQAYYCADNFAAFHSALSSAEDALRSYCPMFFLELILQEYRRRGVDAVDVHHDCPPEMTTCVGIWSFYDRNLPLWRQSTNFGNVLWGLFLDIADPLNRWKESYKGEAADIFEKKVQLLNVYQFVQLEETQVLRRLIANLRENPLDSKLVDKDHDGKGYWEKLCATLSPLMKNEDLIQNNMVLGYETDPTAVGRLHRFVIEASWNPWTVWHDYKMQDPKHRANLTSLDEPREWRELAEYEDEVDVETGRKRPKHSLPDWNTVNYDEFVAAVEVLQ